MEIPIANGFYVSDSLPVSHQECVNFVPVAQQAEALSVAQLFNSPGIDALISSGALDTDVNRGAHDLGGIPYFVNGTTLYRLDLGVVAGVETFSLVSLGTISGVIRVSMADNGTQLMILVPGGNGYIYTVAGGLVQITDADFTANGNPQHVVYIDGYFACTTDTKKWVVSSLNDGTAWSALDFGTAEADPDPTVAPVVYNNQIFITGSETTEGFQNIGGSGFPFQRNNIILDKGCFAPYTLIANNQQFFMIGGGKNEGPAVWAYNGSMFVKKSTIVIDSILESYSTTNLALTFSLAWASKGQYYVAFVLPDRCFVYNITTNKWHEQKSGIANTVGDLIQSRWRVNSMLTAYGYTLVGDYTDGRIGKLNSDTYTEYGNNIIRTFSTPPIYNGSRAFVMPRVELTMEAGVGNSDAPDPQVSLAISKEAKIFNYERNRAIGKVGQYGRRTIWHKNGRYPRFCIMRFRVSDPIKPVVIRLDVDVL